jgi:membrane protease YdiL (CAAX protease family)
MDRRLALWIIAAVPVLALIFYSLTRSFAPLVGYALGLCCHWAFLALVLWRSTTETQRSIWLVVVSPGRWLTFLCILPVFVTGLAGMAALDLVPPGLLLPIAFAAILNATLEEMFWRGAIVPKPDDRSAAMAVILFAGWHVVLLAANGIVLPGGPAVLLVGAALLGSIWMAARLRTGTLGAGILSHAAVNLFAFIALYAANVPAA